MGGRPYHMDMQLGPNRVANSNVWLHVLGDNSFVPPQLAPAQDIVWDADGRMPLIVGKMGLPDNESAVNPASWYVQLVADRRIYSSSERRQGANSVLADIPIWRD